MHGDGHLQAYNEISMIFMIKFKYLQGGKLYKLLILFNSNWHLFFSNKMICYPKLIIILELTIKNGYDDYIY